MSSSGRIHDIISPYPMGDVEKYFRSIDGLISTNSGKHDYRHLTHSSYAMSCPVPENNNTRFKLTDTQFDIVDISQGYLSLKCTMDVTMSFNDLAKQEISAKTTKYFTSINRNSTYFFVGFKSGAHIIDSYTIYSKGRQTMCKNIKCKEEQAVVYSCKSKQERSGRPGMYSVHKDVLKMRNCVCGTYLRQFDNIHETGEDTQQIELDILIQIDDLLPLSGMKLYPQFVCGDLELELSCNLERNMVWCRVPQEEVLRNLYRKPESWEYVKNYPKDDYTEKKVESTVDGKTTTTTTIYQPVDLESQLGSVRDHAANYATYCTTSDGLRISHKFQQCGDFDTCNLGMTFVSTTPEKYDGVTSPADIYGTDFISNYKSNGNVLISAFTIRTSNLIITNAKSHVFGFTIKEESKQNLLRLFTKQGKLVIPAQWVQHNQFNQLPGASELRLHMSMPSYNCGMLIITFPNTSNQLTVSRNPYLQNLRCQLDEKLIPDKEMSTVDHEFGEMCLSALGFNTVFNAPREFMNAIAPRFTPTCKQWMISKEDDSDFMFVVDLERNGAGVGHDGYTNENAQITVDALYINGTENAHFYEADLQNNYFTADPTSNPNKHTLRKCHPQLFAVCDAYWVFTPSGGEFVLDREATNLIRQKEARIRRNHPK